jgi:hypothetical protein
MLIRGEREDDGESGALDRAMQIRPGRFRDVLWIVSGAAHLGALGADPDAYAGKLDEIFTEIVGFKAPSAPGYPTAPK